MDQLLEDVLEAHGGTDRWASLSTVTARITYGGPFWGLKEQPEFVGTALVEATVGRQRVVHTEESTGRVIEFDRARDRVTVTAGDGSPIQTLDRPRASFAGHDRDTPWDVAQMGYFRTYATWLDLLEPYLFTYPGVKVREIEPWSEGGSSWRGLAVTFPETIAAHNHTQRYYLDVDGRLRRTDYQPAVTGRSPVAHYIRAEATFDGIVVPTRRHVHARNPDGTPDLSWTPITLEVGDVRFD